MAAFSRVGGAGWRQGDDAAAQSRIGGGGWYQVIAVGGASAFVSLLHGLLRSSLLGRLIG